MKTRAGYIVGVVNMLVVFIINWFFGLTWYSMILYLLTGVLSRILTGYLEERL